jgi:hypothetical protein
MTTRDPESSDPSSPGVVPSPRGRADEADMKLRTASESVGWLNSDGPLDVSPSFSAEPAERDALLARVRALEQERDEQDKQIAAYRAQLSKWCGVVAPSTNAAGCRSEHP